jgi:hypothetical protein
MLRRSVALLLGTVLACLARPAWAEDVAQAADPPPNYLRPALEIGAGLAAASLWYFVDDRNVLDWDYPSAEQRFNGEAWRFDNNTFALNYVWHPLAGSGMYVLARGNRVGVWPSLAYSFAGSTMWEYVIEFNEKVSINDVIVTPLAGLGVGEFFHKLALHVSDVSPLLAWTFGLSVQGHRQLDGLGPARANLWNDLAFSYGFGVVDSAGSRARGTHLLGFEGRFVSLPGYGAPGRFGHWFHEADSAALELEVDLGAAGPGVDFFAETLLAGYHFQNLSGPRQHLSGVSLSAGLGLAYVYRSNEAFGYDDRQGLLLFPGAASELSLRRGALRGLVELRAYPSFGSMSAPSYSLWRQDNPVGRTKTVLQREGYTFGWGVWTQAKARLGFRSLELRGELTYGHFASIEGLDRSQERVVHDQHLSETPLEYSVGAWATELPVALELGAVFEGTQRTSQMPGIERRVEGRRLLLAVAWPL